MVDYRTRRIESLKAYITGIYKELPSECRKMSMQEFSDFMEARAERLASMYEIPANGSKKIDYEELREENEKSFDFLHLKKSIDELVGMNELNFDESLSLNDVVDMIK